MDKATLKKSLCNCEECSSGSFLLEEKGDDATLRAVTMCDIPKDSLIVKMDKVRFNNFLIDRKAVGFNKHSDYLIITDDKAVLIEIKSKKEVNQDLFDECRTKFISDKCSLDYADDIFQRMMNKNSFFENREFHFVLLHQTLSMAKTPTTPESQLPNLTPDSLRKIPVVNNGTISFFRTI